MRISFENKFPVIDKQAFIACNSPIIGDVVIGAGSSVWYNCVLRGDVDIIRIGNNTNIQDGSIVHTSRYNGPTIIGNNITIGHLCLIHACTIKDNAFIGMHSTIMDHAIIEENAFIAAGSLVTGKKHIGANEVWAGRPASFLRKITERDIAYMQENVANYVALAKKHAQNIRQDYSE